MKNHPLLVMLAALLIGVLSIRFGSDSGYYSMALIRFALTAIMMFIMATMDTSAVLAFPGRGTGFVLKKCLYILILAAVSGGLILVAKLVAPQLAGGPIPSDWLHTALTIFVFCISVGLFEESLFRGVVFKNLLTAMGGTKKGTISAALLSSLIFGFVHVYSYFLQPQIDSAGIIQVVLKTLQTGIIGLILAAVYLKTKNIWAISFVHALNDFLLFVPAVLAGQTPGGYVGTGAAATQQIITYAIMSILYIPAVVSALKIIKSADINDAV